MQLNEREVRVLVIVGLILVVGGAVRLVRSHRPEWAPGVAVTVGDAARVHRSDTTDAGFGTRATLDSLFVDGRLDLNAAGETHLELLPGIGPALAVRVVEHRRTNGPFRSVEELVQVPGIGPKTLERLRPLTCVRTTATPRVE